MGADVYVLVEDGKPKAVYSDIRQMFRVAVREYVIVPLDPPLEEVYRVKVLFDGDCLRWEAERVEWSGRTGNDRYGGTGYLCWFVSALSSERAIEIAKGLFREMI